MDCFCWRTMTGARAKSCRHGIYPCHSNLGVCFCTMNDVERVLRPAHPSWLAAIILLLVTAASCGEKQKSFPRLDADGVLKEHWGQLSTKSLVTILLNEPRFTHRMLAEDALRLRSKVEVSKTLHQLLTPEAMSRNAVHICRILSGVDTQESISTLKELCDSQNPDVRFAAYIALSRVGDGLFKSYLGNKLEADVEVKPRLEWKGAQLFGKATRNTSGQ